MARKIIGMLALLGLFIGFNPALAAKPNYAPEFPDQSGTYDVPGHPNLKVRVFVHNPKPAKPIADPTPIPAICSDPNTNGFVNNTPWHLPSTFTYNLNPASVPKSVSGSLLNIAQAAFESWTKKIPGEVALSKGADATTIRASYDGQNIIAWGRTSGSALAVTYTTYRTDTKEAVDVDTIMNIKFPWSSSSCGYTNYYDAQDILTHELGHWFGLNDEYTALTHIDNTMYGYGSRGETKKNTLEAGDIAGLQAIYQ